MNVLILNGGPRAKGRTATILREMETGAQEAGAEVSWVDVYKLEIAPCRGCLKCRPDGECILPEDDAHALARRVHAADALVVGSPTYWGNVSGPLKTVFDRTVPVFEYFGEGLPKPVQKGKRAAIVTTSNAPPPVHLMASQSRGAVRAMRTVLRSGGYRIAGTINLPGRLGQPGPVPERVLARARRLGARLAGK
jgi:multimeric flavodoxin WrbA